MGTLGWLFFVLPFGVVMFLASAQGERQDAWGTVFSAVFILGLVVVINAMIPSFSKGTKPIFWIAIIALAAEITSPKKERWTLVTLPGRCPSCDVETMSEPIHDLAGLGKCLRCSFPFAIIIVQRNIKIG
jgi:hypothetical protein